MRWKRVAWAGCLAPLFGGCLSVYHPHHDHVAERIVVQSEREITREIHKKARDAWRKAIELIQDPEELAKATRRLATLEKKLGKDKDRDRERENQKDKDKESEEEGGGPGVQAP